MIRDDAARAGFLCEPAGAPQPEPAEGVENEQAKDGADDAEGDAEPSFVLVGGCGFGVTKRAKEEQLVSYSMAR